jgi:hypothetical protein
MKAICGINKLNTTEEFNNIGILIIFIERILTASVV